jgi:kinetochore protein Nuf2
MSSFIHEARPSLGGRSTVAGHNRQAFSFPPLSTNEIILCLHELSIPITEDELNNPDKYKDQVRRIFELLAEMVTGITREEMAQPAFSGLSQLNYPELHEESVPQINSFRACQKMMEVCCIQDFTLKDLMTPSAKRFRRQLSGIINFAKFRAERLGLLHDLTTQREAVLSALNRSKLNNDTLNSRLAALREQTLEESKLIEDTENDIKVAETEISELNIKQAEIRDEIADLKVIRHQIKDSISSRAKQLEEATATKKKLQGQIVNSPERFRKQIHDSADALQQEQHEMRQLERKSRELTAWLVQLDDAHAAATAALEAMQEVKAEVDAQKEAMGYVDEQKELAASKREALKTITQNAQHATRQLAKGEEKLAAIRKQADSRGADTQAELETLHAKIIEAAESRAKSKAKAEKAEAEALRLELEVENDIQNYEQVIEVFILS